MLLWLAVGRERAASRLKQAGSGFDPEPLVRI